MQTLRKIIFALGIQTCLCSTALAQTYSKTEIINYENNTSKWILGQTAAVTDLSTGLVQSATTYDTTYAMPITRSQFGALRQTLTYDLTSSLSSGLFGTLSTVKDGNNKVTTLSSWKRGIPRSIKHPDTYVQSATVNDSGWIESVTDENGFLTSYGYDAMGRISLITYPAGDTTSWSPTTRSVVQVTTSEYGIPAGHWRDTVTTGNSVKITYLDGMWRPLLMREYDSANVTVTQRFIKIAYDSRGRENFRSYPSTSSAPSTGTWSNFDPLDRATSISRDSELGLLTTLITYGTGFKTTVKNPRDYSTTTDYMTYDQPITDWPVSVSAPEAQITTISRNVFGNPTQLSRGGINRNFTYNNKQELCRSIEPETGATLFGYDAAGNLSWSAAGLASSQPCSNTGTETSIVARKISRTYDARNRLSTLSFPDSNGNQTWTYTNDGLPYSIATTNNGNTVSNVYNYNKRRLLISEGLTPDTLQSNLGIGYGYNSLGHRITESMPNNVVLTYSVNALGQATGLSASVAGGAATTLASGASYYPNGAVKQFTYGNGIVHTMTQNARQLPSKSTNCALAGTCAVDNRKLDLAYSFDANGNVTAITDGTKTGQQTRSMGYDGLDRLINTSSVMFGTAGYAYDTADNLSQVTVSGGSQPRTHYYCYSASTNRLDFIRMGPSCSTSLATVALAYDVQGNLSVKNGASYTFDFGNRLRTTAGLTYRYDGLGRRVRQDNAGGQLKYSVYAQDGRVVWQRDEVAGKRINNAYFAGSLLAEVSRPLSSETVTLSFFHTDALGSPIAKSDASGTVTEKSEYEPYGLLLNRVNDDRAGYTGHVMDSASGLIYMQQRYYDPAIGRFLSVDPVNATNLGGNFNRYWYGNNNPYRFTDPDGRCTGSHIANEDGTCKSTGGFTTMSGPINASVGPNGCPGCNYARSVAAKPSFSEMAKNYPQGSAGKVMNQIGGKVAENSSENGGSWQNSCTVRICNALNRSGFSVQKVAQSVTGGDGKQYIYTVKALERYLTQRFGDPITVNVDQGLIDQSKILGRQGIIIFDFGSAASGQSFTGHADLWDGSRCIGSCSSDYMLHSSRVMLWELPE